MSKGTIIIGLTTYILFIALFIGLLGSSLVSVGNDPTNSFAVEPSSYVGTDQSLDASNAVTSSSNFFSGFFQVIFFQVSLTETFVGSVTLLIIFFYLPALWLGLEILTMIVHGG